MSERVRCPVCAQWPTLRKDGALSFHLHPWYDPKQRGKPCPGSRTIPNQPRLEETPNE